MPPDGDQTYPVLFSREAIFIWFVVVAVVFALSLVWRWRTGQVPRTLLEKAATAMIVIGLAGFFIAWFTGMTWWQILLIALLVALTAWLAYGWYRRYDKWWRRERPRR